MIPPTAIALIMNKLVLAFLTERKRMPTVLGLRKREGFLFLGLDLFESMKAIVTEQPAVYVVNIRVTTCTVSFVVYD
jgi:hypothetical protein